MRVLITGATGFVGTVAVRTFLAKGHSVRAALRAPQEGLECESVVVGEIQPDTDWGRSLEGIDAVVHLAARVHVMRDDAAGALQFRRINTDGTLRLARAAEAAGVKRFVFVSSIKVNGEATTGRPFCADDEPHPSDAYARSKLLAERGLLEMDGIETVIIRPPLVYGAGAKGNLARLCRLARSGWPVPLGGIVNRRDLVGVDNLASLIECCVWHPKAAGQVFLVSDGEALSTPQLYHLIAEGLGRRARTLRVPVALMRTLGGALGMGAEIDRLSQSLEVDIGKTRDLLGWAPPGSTASGVSAMARAFESSIP